MRGYARQFNDARLHSMLAGIRRLSSTVLRYTWKTPTPPSRGNAQPGSDLSRLLHRHHAVEDEGERGETVRTRLAELGEAVVAISSLVMMECLVAPLGDENLALHDHYVRAFEQFAVLEQGRPEFLRADELRARHGLRTTDVLHLATAQISGRDQLWTNDARLAAASGGLAVDVSG